MSKTIRVEEDTHAALAALKGDDETICFHDSYRNDGKPFGRGLR